MDDAHGLLPSSSMVADGWNARRGHRHFHELGCLSTYTRRMVPITDLKPEHIDIYDIAHSLARICRYNGHVSGFLSVAEHSVFVAKLVEAEEPEHALEALLHDASEAYLGDIVGPLKHMPEMAWYRECEERAERAIAMRFNLTFPWPPTVKRFDKQEQDTEMDFRRYNEAWSTDVRASKTMFMETFIRLARSRPYPPAVIWS